MSVRARTIQCINNALRSAAAAAAATETAADPHLCLNATVEKNHGNVVLFGRVFFF